MASLSHTYSVVFEPLGAADIQDPHHPRYDCGGCRCGLYPSNSRPEITDTHYAPFENIEQVHMQGSAPGAHSSSSPITAAATLVVLSQQRSPPSSSQMRLSQAAAAHIHDPSQAMAFRAPTQPQIEIDTMEEQARHNVDDNVMSLLEMARESDDGFIDADVLRVLEAALEGIWARITSEPETYLMTIPEFSVFLFFQRRFDGDERAIKARCRFWHLTRGPLP